MDEREGGGDALVLQVRVGAEELRRHQHPLVDDRARAEAREDEVGAGGELGDAADHVELALEGLGVEAGCGGDDEVSDTGRDGSRRLADLRHDERHVAPRDDALAFVGDGALDERLELGAAVRVGRQEADRDAVLAGRRQLGVDHAAEEFVGQLDQDPGAVARPRVGAGGAAVLEVLERPDRAHDGLVARDAVELRDRADPAGVVLVGRVVEADPACGALPGGVARCGAGRHRNLSL